MTVISLSCPKSALSTVFDSSSKGYQAVTNPAMGRLYELKKYFNTNPDMFDQLHVVSKNGALFSPLHYEINGKL